MAEVENLKSKSLYKLLLIMLKYIPIMVVLSYVLNTFLAYVGIDIPILSILSGMSVLTWLFMYLCAIVFRFCIYHRISLYYILITDIINMSDYYIGIPITDFELLMLHSIIIGTFIFIISFIYVKNYSRPINKDS